MNEIFGNEYSQSEVVQMDAVSKRIGHLLPIRQLTLLPTFKHLSKDLPLRMVVKRKSQ